MTSLEEKSKSLTIDFKQLVVDSHPKLDPEQKQVVILGLLEGVARRLMAQTSILEKMEAYIDGTPPPSNTRITTIGTALPDTTTRNVQAGIPLVEDAVEATITGDPSMWLDGYSKKADLLEIHILRMPTERFKTIMDALRAKFGASNVAWVKFDYKTKQGGFIELKGWRGKYQ